MVATSGLAPGFTAQLLTGKVWQYCTTRGNTRVVDKHNNSHSFGKVLLFQKFVFKNKKVLLLTKLGEQRCRRSTSNCAILTVWRWSRDAQLIILVATLTLPSRERVPRGNRQNPSACWKSSSTERWKSLRCVCTCFASVRGLIVSLTMLIEIELRFRTLQAW